MSLKRVRHAGPARAALWRGVETLGRAVRVTLGPRGRYVLIDRQRRSPLVTKDGVTVAREIELADRFENAGAALARDAAIRTADDVGDGTTTATVIAQALVRSGLRLVAAGVNPVPLKRGIDRAVATATEALRAQSRRVLYREDVARVARIAANGDAPLADLIAEAMERVGRDGRIEVDDARGIETGCEYLEGIHWEQGFVHPGLATDPARGECVLEEPFILLNQLRLRSLRSMAPLFEAILASGRPLLIVSEGVEGDALATLLLNKQQGKLVSCAVRCGYFGQRRIDFLHDLAAVTGAQPLTEDRGVKLENISLDMLGRARRVVVSRSSTLLLGGAGGEAAIEARVGALKAQLEHPRHAQDERYLRERIAKLVGGLALLHVGGPTESEIRERKGRIEDALHAALAAVDEGVVAGGGVALLRCQPAVSALVETMRAEVADLPAGDGRRDEIPGARMVLQVLAEPLARIARNGGRRPAVVIDRVLAAEGSFGYDAQADRFCDLDEAGVVDATKVVRSALGCGASVASMILTAEALVVQVPEPPRPPSAESDDAPEE